MKNNRFVTSSKIDDKLKAVTHFSIKDRTLESFQDVLKFGTEEDILKFIESKNIFNSNIFTSD